MGLAAPEVTGSRLLAQLDHLFFGLAGLSSVWLAYLLVRDSRWDWWQLLVLVVFWLLVAYLVLPRLHRVLTDLYVPNYFIGRARTSDGLLGDPVNVAVLGSEAQLLALMAASGWTRADPVTLASSWRIVQATVTRRSYAEAPVSPLNLFGRPQDVAFQQEVDGSPAQRHHVRFWRCPDGWLLPGGFAADWLAAATFDRRVGLSLFTLQITHKIAADTDVERDHAVATWTSADPAVTVRVLEDFATGYHARNGGGDAITTDGNLPVVDVRQVVADPSTPAAPVTPAGRRRPAATSFGAVAVAARATATLTLSTHAAATGDLPTLAGAAAAAAAVVDLVLGVATYLGRNWGRVLVLAGSVVTVGGAWLNDVVRGERPTFHLELPTVALSVLVMLALSSHAARDYATTNAAS